MAISSGAVRRRSVINIGERMHTLHGKFLVAASLLLLAACDGQLPAFEAPPQSAKNERADINASKAETPVVAKKAEAPVTKEARKAELAAPAAEPAVKQHAKAEPFVPTSFGMRPPVAVVEEAKPVEVAKPAKIAKPVPARKTVKKAPVMAVPHLQEAAFMEEVKPVEPTPAPAVVATGPLSEQIGKAPVGQMFTTNGTTGEQLAVLEEYDSATGERCRRYAIFVNNTSQGRVQTACKAATDGKWVALRPLSHETMSPLASMPNFSAASNQVQ
jgi:hypothetical protein